MTSVLSAPLKTKALFAALLLSAAAPASAETVGLSRFHADKAPHRGYYDLVDTLVSALKKGAPQAGDLRQRLDGAPSPAADASHPGPAELAESISANCLDSKKVAMFYKHSIMTVETTDEKTGETQTDYFLECKGELARTNYYRVLTGPGGPLYTLASSKEDGPQPPQAAAQMGPAGSSEVSESLLQEAIRVILATGVTALAIDFIAKQHFPGEWDKKNHLKAGSYTTVLAYMANRVLGLSKKAAAEKAWEWAVAYAIYHEYEDAVVMQTNPKQKRYSEPRDYEANTIGALVQASLMAGDLGAEAGEHGNGLMTGPDGTVALTWTIPLCQDSLGRISVCP